MDQLEAGPTKVCKTCGKEKALDPDFPVRRKLSDGHEGRCRLCKQLGCRAEYTREEVRSSQAARTKKLRAAVRMKVYEYLLDHPCTDCGEDDPIVLQFDHVRGTKVAAVGECVSRGWSWARVLTEIAKCEVRCANCHLRKTVERAGWLRPARRIVKVA